MVSKCHGECCRLLTLWQPYVLGKEEDSPIPLKATLARSATRRPAKKVPPISSTDKYSSRDDDVDSAYAASMESTLEAESHMEVSIQSHDFTLNSLDKTGQN